MHKIITLLLNIRPTLYIIELATAGRSSAPGFEDTMRCNSVAAGEMPTAITPEQRIKCAHQGHAECEGMQEESKAK